MRRRLSQGLQFSANYALGNQQVHSWQTFRRDVFMIRDAGDPGDITHVFKIGGLYDLPFGQGRRFGGNVNGFVNRLIGDWSLSMVSRIQSGRLIDFGNVRMVGMTADDLQGMFKLRFDDAGKKVWMLPQDVIDNTIRAFSVSATSASGYGAGGPPTGRYLAPANGPDCIEIDNGADYGDCGTRSLVVTGPMFQMHDFSVAKRVTVVGRTNLEFRFEMLNAVQQRELRSSERHRQQRRRYPQQLRGHWTHRREHRARDSARYTVQLVRARRRAGRVAQPGRLSLPVLAGTQVLLPPAAGEAGNSDHGCHQPSLPSRDCPSSGTKPLFRQFVTINLPSTIKFCLTVTRQQA